MDHVSSTSFEKHSLTYLLLTFANTNTLEIVQESDGYVKEH